MMLYYCDNYAIGEIVGTEVIDEDAFSYLSEIGLINKENMRDESGWRSLYVKKETLECLIERVQIRKTLQDFFSYTQPISLDDLRSIRDICLQSKVKGIQNEEA